MAKYAFDRLGPERFEEMLKALLEDRLRVTGKLIQFGDGPDGGREATWTQPPEHPEWVQPRGRRKKSPRHWVFQAKYHFPSLVRNRNMVGILEQELRDELNKLVGRYQVDCDTYVLVTNIALSGVRFTGSRDRLETVAGAAIDHLDFRIWDAIDLASMLDGAPAVRQTYLDALLPGDVLAAVLERFEGDRRRLRQVLRTYLDALADPTGSAATARTAEAGDESDHQLRLRDVYVDLEVSSQDPQVTAAFSRLQIRGLQSTLTKAEPSKAPRTPTGSGTNGDKLQTNNLPASVALLLPPGDVSLFLAGPGYGKSTLCQFLALFHASRLVHWRDTKPLDSLSARLSLPSTVPLELIDSACTPRIPFRVELRRYATWLGDNASSGIATYIAQELINPIANSSIDADDVFSVIEENASLLILDGLDEVPHSELRARIVADLQTYVRRATVGARADIQVVLSSRPQGYNHEFLAFEPLTYTIADLAPSSLWSFAAAWMRQRIKDPVERQDAHNRLQAALESDQVRALATTLLQVTVMLSIARARKDIPQERTSLFRLFVDVMFARERDKSPTVREYERELRYLHALVGYRIHRQLESGHSDGVSLDDFRTLAARTWADFSAEEAKRGARSAIASIITAARDRLVFLKGQGEAQAEIGFLLASYREYFAAEYLKVHERANHDRVLDALLVREGHWENVLRFFVGFQDPAIQISWSDRINDGTPADLVAFIDLVRARRVLLRLLGEFRDVHRASFNRTLSAIFAENTGWTWADQPVAPILQGIRNGGPALQIASEAGDLLDTPDLSLFESRLSLLLSLMDSAGPNASHLERVRVKMLDGKARPFVVGKVLQGRLAALRDKITVEDLLSYSTFDLERLSGARQLPLDLLREYALLNGSGGLSHLGGIITRRRSRRLVEVDATVAVSLHSELSKERPRLAKPYLALARGGRRPIYELAHAVDGVLKSFGDARAGNKLRKIYDGHSDLRGSYIGHFARLVAPPSGELFASASARARYWRARRKVASDGDISEFARLLSAKAEPSLVTGRSETWLCVLLPHAIWDRAVDAGLMASSAVQAVRESAFGPLLEESPRIPPLASYAVPRGPALSAGLGWVLVVILRELSGGLALPATSLNILGNILLRGELTPVVRKELEAVLEARSGSAKSLGSLRGLAVGAIVLWFPDKLEWMIELWRFASEDEWVPGGVEPSSEVLEALAARKDRVADALVVELLRIIGTRSLSSHVGECVTRVIRNSRSKRELWGAAWALQDTEISPVEIDAWRDSGLWDEAAASRVLTERLCARLLAPTPTESNEIVWRAVTDIVERRDEFPTTAVRAALSRVIALRCAQMPPLEDRDWQRP